MAKESRGPRRCAGAIDCIPLVCGAARLAEVSYRTELSL